MRGWGKLLSVLTRAALDRLIGERRTDELIAAIEEIRATSAAALPPPAGGAATVEMLREVVEDVAGGRPAEESPEVQDQAAFVASTAAAELPVELITGDESPLRVAEAMLAALPLPGREGTYLVWHEAQGVGCFVHFYYYVNQEKGQTVYRIRDYLHRRIHLGGLSEAEFRARQTSLRGAAWTEVVHDLRDAAEVWRLSRRRVKCVGAFGIVPVENDRAWRRTLDELTRALAT